MISWLLGENVFIWKIEKMFFFSNDSSIVNHCANINNSYVARRSEEKWI